MKTLYLERSTGESRDGNWVEALDLDGVERIVVGIGPGSFAGIRSALAFAQGFALARGGGCEVMGLPSACALADGGKLAVIGDARRGKFWVAQFDGYEMEGDVHQVDADMLRGAIPADYRVVTPDSARIDALLRETFGAQYIGGVTPTDEGLRRFAEKNPAILKREPLPIYLNPAVRDN